MLKRILQTSTIFMINSLINELRAIAQSILDEGDNLDIPSLEARIRTLQKQLAIVEYEQKNKPQNIEFEEKKEVLTKETIIETKVLDSENLFSNPIDEPVFIRKESNDVIEKETIQRTSKNLNDTLGKGLKIGLNDRLAFIKNLFNENPEEYQRVINQLQTYQDFEEACFFLEKLVKPEYNFWEGKETYEKRFYQIIEKNFN